MYQISNTSRFIVASIVAVALLLSKVLLASEATLLINRPDSEPMTLSIDTLKSKIDSQNIQLYDPFYDKQKKYDVFSLQELLGVAFESSLLNGNYTAIQFTSIDGYKAVIDLSKINNNRAYMAFADRDDKNWQLINHYNVKPGPFYIVWDGKFPKEGYSWPWQVATLELVSTDKFAKIAPKNTKNQIDDKQFSMINSGFRLFKKRCTNCHAVDKVGGTVGPDLGAPKTILDYRSEAMFRAFVVSPSSFRYTKMPDFGDLSTPDMDGLVSYFRYLQDRKSLQTGD